MLSDVLSGLFREKVAGAGQLTGQLFLEGFAAFSRQVRSPG